MKTKKIKIIIILIVIQCLTVLADATQKKPDYPTVLNVIYSRLTTTIFKIYILKEKKFVIFLPAVAKGELDTTITYNCNRVLISRLKKKIRSSGNPLLKNIQLQEGQFKNTDPNHTVYLEIETNSEEIEFPSFQLKVQLKEVSSTGKRVIETLNYQGYDENIQDYIPPAPKLSFVVWIFFVVTGLIFLMEMVRILLRKKKIDIWIRLLPQENYPYWRMAIVSILMIFLFSITIFFIKRDAIEGHAYFEGAEVHFLIDCNTGLFFDAGENNFINLMQGILKETCHRISMKIHHPDTSELEKQGDLLTRVINWMLEKIGWERFRMKKFADLKQSDYSYYIYTFSEEDIALKQSGNLAELVVDYQTLIAPVLGQIDAQVRQSSLVKPVGLLYNKLVDSQKKSKPKKKFIIIFSDAAESFLSEVEAFLNDVKDFYAHKDQYLRVFSVLFPNIPRTSSNDHIYPYEEGKILLLSKISEFIVYLNDIQRYTPGKMQNVNKCLYEMMAKEGFTPNSPAETSYLQRLSHFKSLSSHIKGKKLLNIHEINQQGFLKNHVEVTAAKQKTHDENTRIYNDFFLYTFVKGLYNIDNLDFEHRRDWVNVGDYNLARGKLFGGHLDKEKMNQAIKDIADTFVNQFIIIDKEPDKESMIAKISLSITIFAIILSIIYALLLFRYKYDANYCFEKKEGLINIFMMGLTVMVLILSFIYFRYENRWSIYGNWFWAFFLSMAFLFSYYYLPLIFRRYLPPFLFRISRLTRKMLRKENLIPNMSYQMIDSTFSFDEVKWLKWLNRILFNIIIAPLLSFSLFMQILSPVYKQGSGEMKEPFISAMDTIFRDLLNISDYNKNIEYFLLLWMMVVGIYLARAFIYSKSASPYR